MSAGGDFTLVPQLVTELEPSYNNAITDMESMKKEYLNISSTPILRYRLNFKALTTANKDTLLGHYKDQYGGYHSFTWKSVPSYIGSGANITGRWVEGSLNFSTVGNNHWTAEITFEKAN